MTKREGHTATSGAGTGGSDVGGHDFERVEEAGDGYVLVCECGWRSEPERSAATVGQEWDSHRADEAPPG
jgi:hypothetical protein